mmetsp:Transcript_8544/g.12187  ORF Transcript_8544/g.12187 Transcript_8544/m.12187 type:complete len:133 (-) Transcript_8544:474-872(-)
MRSVFCGLYTSCDFSLKGTVTSLEKKGQGYCLLLDLICSLQLFSSVDPETDTVLRLFVGSCPDKGGKVTGATFVGSCPDKGGKVTGVLEDRNGSELPRLLEVGVRVCPPNERVPKELDDKGAVLVLANKVEK